MKNIRASVRALFALLFAGALGSATGWLFPEVVGVVPSSKILRILLAFILTFGGAILMELGGAWVFPRGSADPTEDREYNAFDSPPVDHPVLQPLVLVLGVLLMIWTLPALLVAIEVTPENYVRAAQVVALLSGGGIGSIYWQANPEEFETTADTVTFFSACLLGPPTAIGFLF